MKNIKINLEIRQKIHNCFEKARDYDENHPRQLRKYVFGYVIIEFISILSSAFFITLFQCMIFLLILIPAALSGSISGVLDSNVSESDPSNMDIPPEKQDEFKTGLESFYSLDTLTQFFGFWLIVQTLFFVFGKWITHNLSLTFPVLFDIKFDTEWLYINPLYILRTFFNLIQFVLIFYIIRKLKKKLKRKINRRLDRDYDFFDKKFYNLS